MVFLLILLLLVFVITILVLRQPDNFNYARTITINAVPSVIFERVNDLHKWYDWSPWAKLDPNNKTSFTGPDKGVGTSMNWEGNNKVGKGTMTIIENKPHELVKLRLDFLKPFKATNIAEFTFTPQGGQTIVTWSMTGKAKFMGKVMNIFMNCEKMVGGMFSKGLASLKSLCETGK